MSLEHYDIKSSKQENGLWGTPIKLKSLRGEIPIANDEKMKILSAVFMAFCETNDEDFDVDVHNNIIHINAEKVYYYRFHNFELIDNRLYFISTDEDRKMFNRILKLNKLCQIKK